jgi:RimJ/RimL family protein N-acetyltransferase
VPIDATIPYPDPPLAGARFVLRPFRVGDFAAALEFEADPASARWVPPLPSADGAGVVEFFEECRVAGEMLHLVVADIATDAYSGEVMVVIGEHRVAELGCGIIPALRGRGVATEALRILTRWVFATLGLGRLQVFIAQENLPALELAERAGFRREGVLRDYWESEGVRVDTVIMSLLPDDAA